MNITSLGAAHEVTGSCILVETADSCIQIDCGMIQGGREAAVRNRQPSAFDPGFIDFVLLTNAHIQERDAERLRAELAWDVDVPEHSQCVQHDFGSTPT